MELRRGDIGLVISAAAAAGLIGTFLSLTDGSAGEGPDAAPVTTTATTVAAGRLVRVDSPQVPEVAWSSARGEFRIHCRRGRPVALDARITALPPGRRYAWRVITGDANETRPLRRLRDMTAEVVDGEGLPGSFAPIDGEATVRFRFGREWTRWDEPLGLNVLGVHRFDAFVLAAPRMVCRPRGSGA